MRLSQIALFGALVVVTVLPAEALAQLVPCSGPDCNSCHIVSLIQGIIRWLVGVLVVLGAIGLAVSGLRMAMSGGDSGAVSAAKNQFTNIIIGFIILLGAWLFVDTIMQIFTDQGRIGPWNNIQCTTALPPLQDAQRQAPPAGTAAAPGTVTAGRVRHADAVSQLSTAGVTVSSTAGPAGVREICTGSGCTSLNNIRQDTIQQVLNIREACPTCTLTITGGTEGGHAGGAQSHGTGYKIDIDDNAALDQFIQNNLRRDGSRGGSHGGPRYRDSCGNEYVRESTHWDITVSNGSCSLGGG